MLAPSTRISAVARSSVIIVSIWLFAPSILIPPLSGGECSAVAPGHVLLVRGVLTIFSLGLDNLASELKAEGLDAQVVPASLSFGAAEGIAQQYASGRTCGPLVLIGHSLGGDLLPLLAKQFGHHGMAIDLLVMIDSTNPGEPPPNVRRCVNLYQSNSSPTWFRVFRGTAINASSPNTELVNIDIRELAAREEAAGLNHFNIDSSARIHRMVLREVLPVFRSGSDTAVPSTITNASGRFRIPTQTTAGQLLRSSRECLPSTRNVRKDRY